MANRESSDPLAEVIDLYVAERRRQIEDHSPRAVGASQAIAIYRALPWYRRLWEWIRL